MMDAALRGSSLPSQVPAVLSAGGRASRRSKCSLHELHDSLAR